MAAKVHEALERHERIRAVIRDKSPDVDRALALLREHGLFDPKLELGVPTKVEPGALAAEVDDAMGVQAAPLGQLLESEAFKGKWDDMLKAGGDEAQRLFAPMVERAVKKARSGPYGGQPDGKQADEKQGP